MVVDNMLFCIIISFSFLSRPSTAPVAEPAPYMVPPLYSPGGGPSPIPVGHTIPISPHVGPVGTQFFTQTQRGPVGPMEILHHRDYQDYQMGVSMEPVHGEGRDAL